MTEGIQAGVILTNTTKECWDSADVSGTDEQRRLRAGGCDELASGVNEGRHSDEKGVSARRVTCSAQ